MFGNLRRWCDAWLVRMLDALTSSRRRVTLVEDDAFDQLVTELLAQRETLGCDGCGLEITAKDVFAMRKNLGRIEMMCALCAGEAAHERV